ncbi:MAG: cytochrome c [Planctomycetes bacterium]|nr:cytochrome c [Planctomycetota bacterium]
MTHLRPAAALAFLLLATLACAPSEPDARSSSGSTQTPATLPAHGSQPGDESRDKTGGNGGAPTEPTDDATDGTGLPAEVRAAIDASLAELFGTFENPRYERLDSWGEIGFDPSIDAYSSAGAASSGDATAAREEFARSASTRWMTELEHVRRGDFQSVHLPEYALALLIEIHELGRKTPLAERDEALRGFVEAKIVDWYPTLAEARSIYHVHCESCHGAQGRGDGPTSFGHDPRPRDFTSGTFKFTSRVSRAKPTRADLLRTLSEGLAGTGMASYGGLSRAELEGAIDWVRWLALRAAVERELLATYEIDGEISEDAAHEAYASAWDAWLSAESRAVPVPTPTPTVTPERVARGRELFLDPKKGNCAQCHGESGRGDGPASYTLEPGGVKQSIVDDWGHPIRPRDLVEGKFRGGRKPEDVYRRIYAGINGTPMPALGDSKDANGAPLLSEDELWDLAFFALSLKP